jgi:hypothetical protein
VQSPSSADAEVTELSAFVGGVPTLEDEFKSTRCLLRDVGLKPLGFN